MDSILTSIKKLLNIGEDYNYFDTDIIIHINTVFSKLHQLGVGPDKPFRISGAEQTWDQFIGTQSQVEAVKDYIYLNVKLLFDPPQNGFTTTSYENMIKELEWRLNVAVDPTKEP